MGYQATFKRYEIKYLLTPGQKAEILQAMAPYMKLDRYGRTVIRNIYYDTNSFRLIRRSLEKPAYKEKLRIRSYQRVAGEDPVFVELKKKYQSVVYKRRLTLPEAQAMYAFRYNLPLPVSSQIAREIEYFRVYYGGCIPRCSSPMSGRRFIPWTAASSALPLTRTFSTAPMISAWEARSTARRCWCRARR